MRGREPHPSGHHAQHHQACHARGTLFASTIMSLAPTTFEGEPYGPAAGDQQVYWRMNSGS